MTLYTVHVPAEAPSDRQGLARAELVKDGFHWWAFVLPFLWLLANRIWWGVLCWLALTIGVTLLGQALSLPGQSFATFEFLAGLFLGFVAGDLKGWQLGRRGYRLVDVVSGRNEEEAERRFFDRAAAKAPAPAPSKAPPPLSPMPPRASSGVQPVIGLFPEAGGAR